MDERRNLIQIANRIQQALTKIKHQRYIELLSQITKFAGWLQQIVEDSGKLQKSLLHNWSSAADHCCDSINRSLNDISYSISQTRQLTDRPEKNTPQLSSLFEELIQLQQEFDEIDFDKNNNTISVVTEPINLEEIYFGPFKIQLQLDKLSYLYKASPYSCIALDPHQAATADEVTHPHVSNEQLCEGEGSVTIRVALEQGRLSDFFTMVKSILNTYNPDSPYVSLYDWEGSSCYDCGYTMGSEDTYYCCFCERDYCEQCSTYCRSCDEPICSSCVCRCADCNIHCCPSCLEDNLCPNCKEQLENENEEQENRQTSQNETPSEAIPEDAKLKTTSPEVQPNSLGKAIVFQG